MSALPTALPALPAPVLPALPSGKLLGHLAAFRKDPIPVFRAAQAACGDIARIRVGPTQILALAHPAHARHILVERAEIYAKNTRGQVLLRALLGQGLLTSEGAAWRQQRRIAQPAFHKRCVEAFAETMVRATEDLLAGWAALPAGEPVDLMAAMNQLTLRIAGETLFSMDLSASGSAVGEALSAVLGGFLRLVTAPVPGWQRVPTPANLRYRRAVRTLDRVVYEIIAARRADPRAHADLLGLFMASEDAETGARMSDTALRDEVLTMLLAGHETTANALAWTFHLLGQHPDEARRLEADLDAALGDGPITLDALQRLPRLAAVLNESMRLYPPAWILSRRAEADDEIGGYPVAKGSLVFVAVPVLHRHPAFWADPERFDPDRFTPEGAVCPDGRPRPPMAFLPFGAGQRKCIGARMAEMEAQIVLASVLRRFRLRPVPDRPVRPVPTVTLRPEGGPWAWLEGR